MTDTLKKEKPSLSKPITVLCAEKPVVSFGDYLLTDAGQKELLSQIQDQEKANAVRGMSPLTIAGSSLMPVSPENLDEWEEVELYADPGACDNVMPRKMGERIPIVPSEQSKQNVLYEVANSQTIPNLGERKLLMWPENSESPKRIAMQVADVHKALLSLSRCADMGYESRFGKWAGALIHADTGEVIPLIRKGNLYVLKVWIRQDPFAGRG